MKRHDFVGARKKLLYYAKIIGIDRAIEILETERKMKRLVWELFLHSLKSGAMGIIPPLGAVIPPLGAALKRAAVWKA